jgi:isochorismate hydrolase
MRKQPIKNYPKFDSTKLQQNFFEDQVKQLLLTGFFTTKIVN